MGIGLETTQLFSVELLEIYIVHPTTDPWLLTKGDDGTSRFHIRGMVTIIIRHLVVQPVHPLVLGEDLAHRLVWDETNVFADLLD